MREITSIPPPPSMQSLLREAHTTLSKLLVIKHLTFVCYGKHYHNLHSANQNDPPSVTVISSLPNILTCPQKFLHQMDEWLLNQTKRTFCMQTGITISCSTRSKKTGFTMALYIK